MDYTTLQKTMAYLTAILLGALAGAGIYTFVYAQGASYLSDNPEACINCHIMNEQFDGWMKSSHRNAAGCNDCHVDYGLISKWLSKGENGFYHSVAFTFQNFHEPIQLRERSSRVLERNCLRCHLDFVDTITAYHRGVDDDISCVKCHSTVGHGPIK